MSKPNAIFGVARIRTLEKSLITKDKMMRLAESAKEDCMRFLQEIGYGQNASADNISIEDSESIIESELEKTYREIDSLSEADSRFISLFRLKYDIQNLKLLLKLRLTKSNESPVYAHGGIYPPSRLEQAVQNSSYDFLPDIIEQALTRLELSFFTKVEPQKISTILDSAYIEYAIKTGNAFAKKYFSLMSDYNNIITFIRLKKIGGDLKTLKELLLFAGNISHDSFIKLFDEDICGAVKKLAPLKSQSVEFEKAQSAAVFEKARDNELLMLVKEHREELDTALPILGYMLAKEQEAKCVRIILTAKRNELPPSVIHERLRELYG